MMATKEKETKKSDVRNVKVLIRDDKSFPNVREVEAIYETDKSISEILKHAWVLEVIEDNAKSTDGLEVIKD